MVNVPKAIGLTFISWSTHNVVLELFCHRLFGNSVEENSTLFTSLTYAARENLAIGLMKKNGVDDLKAKIAALKKIAAISKRNKIAHSILMMNEGATNLTLLSRDLKHGHRVNQVELKQGELGDSIHRLCEAVQIFQDLVEISDEDVNDYVSGLIDLGKS